MIPNQQRCLLHVGGQHEPPAGPDGAPAAAAGPPGPPGGGTPRVPLPAAVAAQLGGDAHLEEQLVDLFDRMDNEQLATLFDSLNAVGRVDNLDGGQEVQEQAEQEGNGGNDRQ